MDKNLTCIKEKNYQSWIRLQPSCISGRFSEYINGVGMNIAAHVRRVKWGSGIAIKPPLAYVPLTDEEHKLTHQKGERIFNPPEWWEEQVIKYQSLYNRNSIAVYF